MTDSDKFPLGRKIWNQMMAAMDNDKQFKGTPRKESDDRTWNQIQEQQWDVRKCSCCKTNYTPVPKELCVKCEEYIENYWKIL